MKGQKQVKTNTLAIYHVKEPNYTNEKSLKAVEVFLKNGKGVSREQEEQMTYISQHILKHVRTRRKD